MNTANKSSMKMSSIRKRFVATGLAAGLVAGAGAGLILQSSGFAGASSSASAASTPDASTPDTDREAERTTRLTEVLAPLVEAGTIDADQSTAVVEALVAARPIGGGRGGHGGHGGRGGHGGHGPGLEAAATAMNMTEVELKTALEVDGATLASVAAAQGLDVQTVIDALVAAATTRIDDKVAAGDLDQAEADEKLAELETRITDRVNNGRPERGERRAGNATTGT